MIIVNGMPKNGTHAVMAWLTELGMKRRPGTILPAPGFNIRTVGCDLEALKHDQREGVFILAHVPADRVLWGKVITVFRDPRNVLVSYCRHRAREDQFRPSVAEAIRDFWGEPFVPTYLRYLAWRGRCTVMRYESLGPLGDGSGIYASHNRDWNTFTGSPSKWRDAWSDEAEDAWITAGGPELLEYAGYAPHHERMAAMKILSIFTKRYRYRSSVTGKWVSKAFADANPDTTQREKA